MLFRVFDNSCPGYELSDDENDGIQPPQDVGACDQIQSQGTLLQAHPLVSVCGEDIAAVQSPDG